MAEKMTGKFNPALKSLLLPLAELKQDPKNARLHSDKNLKSIMDSLEQFGQQKPVVLSGRSGLVLAGNGTLESARRLGWSHLAAVKAHGLTEQQELAYAIADNRTAELAEWDDKVLVATLQELKLADFKLDDLGFSGDDFNALLASMAQPGDSKASLAEKFIVPPFSILDSRQGYWKERKSAWLKLGIESEVGRKGNLLGMSNTLLQPDPKKRAKINTKDYSGGNAFSGNAFSGNGTSVFDPVLCELTYRWFCPDKGTVLDPFAGGSVRGLVASMLNYKYVGVDLRAEQVSANKEQYKKISKDNILAPEPTWIVGDSQDVKKLAKGIQPDLLFSCPPYADLEVYSDDPRDLSTLSYDEFVKKYRLIIKESVALLKPNSFAVFVVGDVRDPKGFYRNFVGHTVQAFEDAGALLYNEAVFITSVGTLSIRAGRTFSAGRKLGKTHQNVLVFYKGDPKAIKARFPTVDVAMPEGTEDAEA